MKSMDSVDHTREVYNKVAVEYQDKFMNLDLYNDTYDLFCKYLSKPGSAILDVGCGPGNISRYLLDSRPDFNITGVDFAVKMIDLARVNCPEGTFEIMDCRDLSSLDKKFHGVISGFCIPYLNKEECNDFVKDCSSKLLPSGKLYLSFVEGDYNESGWQSNSKGTESVFLYFYDENSLSDMLSEHNLKPVSVMRKQYGSKDSKHGVHIIIIADNIS